LIIYVHSVVQTCWLNNIHKLFPSVHIIQCSTHKIIPRETAKIISENFIKTIKTCLYVSPATKTNSVKILADDSETMTEILERALALL